MAFINNSGGDLTVDTYSLAQAGQDMVQNATDLGTHIRHFWNIFQNNYSTLPPYLHQMLSDYENKRSQEFTALLQRRQKAGQLLQKASSLFEFNEQALQSVFKGLDPWVDGGQDNPKGVSDLLPPDGWIESSS